MNHIANARHAHNPKVEGSNPSPATKSPLPGSLAIKKTQLKQARDFYVFERSASLRRMIVHDGASGG
jgi:hypothetical protein